jgi:sulfonate transport system substrate-binding protein
MNKKLGLVALLVIAAALAGIFIFRIDSPTSPQPAQVPQAARVVVRVNAPFPAIDFAPFFVAKNKRWFEEALASVGATPEYQAPSGSAPVAYDSLATNRVDMIMSSAVRPMISRAEGNDVKIAWLSCTLKSDVVVRTDARINSIRDLKGKKVGTLTGGDTHIWLIRNLLKSGLPRDYVTFVNLSPPDGKAAFNTGQIDAWAMFPPFSTQELVDGTAKAVAGIDAPVQVVLVSRGAFHREHPAAAAAAIEALERAKQWIIKNPSEAQAIVVKEAHLPLEVVRAAWPNLLWEATLNDAMAAQLQSDADFLASEGFMRAKINVRSDLLSVR